MMWDLYCWNFFSGPLWQILESSNSISTFPCSLYCWKMCLYTCLLLVGTTSLFLTDISNWGKIWKVPSGYVHNWTLLIVLDLGWKLSRCFEFRRESCGMKMELVSRCFYWTVLSLWGRWETMYPRVLLFVVLSWSARAEEDTWGLDSRSGESVSLSSPVLSGDRGAWDPRRPASQHTFLTSGSARLEQPQPNTMFDISSLLGSRFHRLSYKLPHHGASLVCRFTHLLAFSCSSLVSIRPLQAVTLCGSLSFLNPSISNASPDDMNSVGSILFSNSGSVSCLHPHRFNAVATYSIKLLPWLHCCKASVIRHFFFLDTSMIESSICKCIWICEFLLRLTAI